MKESDFEKFEDVRDKCQSLMTAIFYNLTKNEVLNILGKKKGKINGIKDKYKREFLTDRIENYINYINDIFSSNVNAIILFGEDINHFLLNKEKIKMLESNNISNSICLYDEVFNLELIKDIFFNNEYKNILEFDNKHVSHSKITKFKKTNIGEYRISTIDDLLSRIDISSDTLIHGVSPLLKKSNFLLTFQKKLNRDEILNIFRIEKVKNNLSELEKVLDDIQNPKKLGKIKFGKDLIKDINYMKIEKLYYHSSKKKKLFDTFPKDKLNFDLIEIETLEKDDLSNILLNDYKGFIGISYY